MSRPFRFYRRSVGFGSHKGLAKTRYVNDKQITDHYAIIPTGQGMSALKWTFLDVTGGL